MSLAKLNSFQKSGFMRKVWIGMARGTPAGMTLGDCEMRRFGLALLCLFLLGAGLRGVDVWRPVDQPYWRECDIASIARNFYREGMSLFYPRVDWRGDGPGYAEMEFPVYPWSIAVLYKFFGFHEVFGRLLSYAFSLMAMGIFFLLARYLLPAAGAIAASLFFALSPLVIRISNSLQPDGLMFLFYLMAIYAFIRWLDDDSWISYGVAVIATSLAILAKATAAHVGLFFALLVLNEQGLAALRKLRIWVFAAASLFPPLLWYTHAYNLWLIYGNSLGLSNESHWIGLDILTDPSPILGNVVSEIFAVWMGTGLVVAAFGAFAGRSARVVKYVLFWLTSLGVFYLVAAGTTGDSWAAYYHVVSVPPAAILVGLGADALMRIMVRLRLRVVLGLVGLALAVVLGISRVPALFLGSDSPRWAKVAVLSWFAAFLLVLVVAKLWGDWRENGLGQGPSFLTTLVTGLVSVSLGMMWLFQVRQIGADIRPRGAHEMYGCAKAFATALPDNALIVASGGVCRDPRGYPVAYNVSYMFYWLDRKGFTICVEEQSVDALRLLAKRGARYFIADVDAVRKKAGFESDLRRAFPLVQECSGLLLFDLT